VSPIASRILLYFVPPLAFSVLYAVVILVAWRRRVKPDKSVEQLIEAYRNPINTGITVSGFVFPLLGAVIGYVVTKDGNEPRYLAGLVASSLLLVGAISAGLFLAYSFATTATSDKFKIDEKHNLIVPATLVFHFALLVSALVVSLVAFAVDGERMLRPHDAAVALNTAPSAFSITRNNISLGSSRAAVEREWGVPAGVATASTTTTLTYYSQTCRYELKFSGDRLTEFTQREGGRVP
jgi:MFS family permease